MQSRQVISAMEEFEGRVMRELEILKSFSAKLEGLTEISSRLGALDKKIGEQGQRIDAVQAKVNLTMASLSEVRQEQVAAARALKHSTPTTAVEGDGIIHPKPPPPFTSPLVSPLTSPRFTAALNQPQFDPGKSKEVPSSKERDDTSTVSREASSSKKPWMPKMDFPKFSGTDARIWLDGCASYFLLYEIPDSFRVTSATLHMTGDAAQWFHAYKLDNDWPNWSQFRKAVLQEFDLNVHREKMRELMVLKQIGSVEEYKREFSQQVYQLKLYEPMVSETMLVTRFVLGLKDELKAAVEIQLPDTVHKAAAYAKMQEEILSRQKQAKTTTTRVPFQRAEARLNSLPAGDLWKARQLKEYRRENNQCFRCGEKYAPGHVCAKTTVPLATVHSMETQGQEILSDEVLDAVEQQEVALAALQLSVCALAGTDGPSSIRLRACIGNQTILILIDSGSSHSFLDASLLTRIGVQPTTMPVPQTVKVANGAYMPCDKEVKNLSWWINDNEFTYDVKILELGGYDLILGMDWLEQWGEMRCQWKEKWLSFDYNGKHVKLQGLSTKELAQLQEMSLEQVIELHRENEIWATALITTVSSPTVVVNPPGIQKLLQQYADVFAEPDSLPPSRAYDHAIHLVPGATPVNSRPYRYSPLQKDEIERQVQEMIKAGIISPSLSPFASPVLLVKKKDGTWRFCVDYRKLNSITIKSKFPMRVVDELLDELAGTSWFSKLDLRAGYHQIRMLPQDEFKTAFKTHHGQFEFRVMPFGLTNAPSTFQCLMNSIFADHIRKFVLVFMDDILIYSKDYEQHIQHLHIVFDILREHQLYAKMSKCSFAKP